MKKILFIIGLFMILGVSQAGLDVSVSEETYEIGYSKLLEVDIENTGTTNIQNIEIAFVYLESPLTSSTCSICKTLSSYTGQCIEYEDDCFINYGELDAGNSKKIFYSLNVPSSTPPKNYLGKLFVKYYLAGNKEIIDSFEIEVIDDTSLTFENKAVSGVSAFGEFYVSFDLKNNEAYSLKNAEIKIEDSASFFPKESKKILGNILASATKKVNISMEATGEINEGTNHIDVVLTFQNDEGTRFNIIERFNFVIGGETDLEIDVDDAYPSPVMANSKTALSVGILNSGDFSAKSALVQIYDNFVLEPDRYYVGDIDSGEYETATFTIFPNRIGEMPISVGITYFDVLGNSWTHNQTIYLDVNAVSITSNDQSPFLYFGLLIVIGIVIYYLFFKKKKGKK